jgi:hypothetical protein
MSDDPTQVDTTTLLASLAGDIHHGLQLSLEAYRYLQQARVTIHELQRRNAAQLNTEGTKTL